MIHTFHDADSRMVSGGARVKKFEAIARQARRAMAYIDLAESLMDLRQPGLRLEKLKGDRKGQYSIRVNDQYRICFEWREDGAYGVELADYH
jgi:toxin HigB-1